MDGQMDDFVKKYYRINTAKDFHIYAEPVD